MSSEAGGAILQLSIETTNQAITLEEQNNQLRELLKQDTAKLADIESATPQVRAMQQQLADKKALLKRKQTELVEIQKALISALRSQSQSSVGSSPDAALGAVPIVMNKVQTVITDLTEQSVAEQSQTVPIISLFKASETVNKLFDALVESNVIDESPEERHERVSGYVQTQQTILTELRRIVQTSKSEEEDAPEKVVEVANDSPATD